MLTDDRPIVIDFGIAQAGDAQALLREVERHSPDIAVVDIHMPPTQTQEGIRAAIAEGDPQRTRPHIEAAAAGFDDITHINSGIVYRLQLEEARAALAAIRSASPERQEATRH